MAAIDWAFDALGWDEVIHVIDIENGASQSVARKLHSHKRGRGQLPPPYEQIVVDILGPDQSAVAGPATLRVKAKRTATPARTAALRARPESA
jgi:hypothetical protein